MKNLLTAAVFFAAVSSAHAAGPAGHAAAPAAPAVTEAPAATPAAEPAKKMDKKTAAAQCKKDGVKGKEGMKACVSKYTM